MKEAVDGDTASEEVPVVHVSGDIDLATAPALRELLEEKLEQGYSDIVVDLTDVTFLDSTGLGVLVAALKKCREVDGDLRLVITEPRILKLFAITGLQDTFTIADSLAAPSLAGPSDGGDGGGNE